MSALTSYIGDVYGAELILVHFADRPETAVADELAAISRQFDCYIINRRASFNAADSPTVDAIAVHASDWVEVFGTDAERIHDAVDTASVRAGRQPAAGYGHPMTTWDNRNDLAGTAAYIATGGQGVANRKIVLVLGSQADEIQVLDALRARLTQVGSRD